MNELREILQKSGNTVFFGGAGVSTESGIPDFRSADGLYSQRFDYPPETILSHSFFFSHTEEFFRFYREKMLADAAPNPAHTVLARLEAAGLLRAVVTQNIDGLHSAAGSRRVFELHGSVHRNHCVSCGRAFGLAAVRESEGVPRCPCGGIIKPDVVLYEEPLDGRTVEGALAAISAADVLIVAGTSLTVYPAAGMVRYFSGRRLVLINRDETPLDRKADLVLRRPVGEIFSELAI